MNRPSRASDRYRDYVTCPYNPSHTLPPGRVQYHLIKCKKQHPHMNLSTCPYNATHLFRPEDEDEHLTSCGDRQAMEIRMYGMMEPVPGQHGNLNGPAIFGSDLLVMDKEERDEVNSLRRARSSSPAKVARSINASFDGSVIAAVNKNVDGAGIISEDVETASIASSYSRPSSLVRANTDCSSDTMSKYMTPCKFDCSHADEDDEEEDPKLNGVTDRLTRLALSSDMDSKVGSERQRAPISVKTNEKGESLGKVYNMLRNIRDNRSDSVHEATMSDVWDD